MSTQGVLTVAPTELRRSCQLLRGASAELEALGTRVLAVSAGAGTDSQSWSGLAALEQRARTHAVHALIASTTGPPETVAAAVERCADQAEVAAQQVRSWGRVQEQALAQTRALQASGPPPEPALEQVWRRRLLELEQEQGLAIRRSQEAEDEFSEAQRRAADIIERAWSTVREIGTIATLANNAWKALGLAAGIVTRLALATDAALAMARARSARGPRARARATGRARARLSQLREVSKPGYTHKNLKGLKMTPGPLGLVMSVLGAGSDVRTGGGYGGWRGNVTRGFAGVAIAGVPMILVTPLFPPGALIGVSMISAYSAWSIGNALWDSRGTVVRYARRIAAGLGSMRKFAVRAGKHASLRMQQVRGLIPYATGTAVLAAGRGIERSWKGLESRLDLTREVLSRPGGLLPGGPVSVPLRETVNEVLGRLPDVEHARQWWRDVGEPIRLPAVPLGPVLRIPVDLGRLWP